MVALAVMSGASVATATPLRLERAERERLKKETIHAIDLIQSYHYTQTSFAEIDAKELIEAYMEDLDFSRLFFTEGDRQEILERFESTLKPTYLFVGDLYPAFEIFNIYQQRVEARIAWINERLKGDFDFTGDDTYTYDRSELPWPADEAEADRLWELRLKFELVAELVDGEPLERAKETIGKRYERMARYMDEIEVRNVQETFLTALAQLYDPHSNFFSWDSAQEFDIQISNSLVGIGAQLRDIDGYCVIEKLIPGGPAEMSGEVHPGDRIVAVAQGSAEPVDTVGMKLRKVVQMIRGEEGSEVRLTIVAANSSERKVVRLLREKVELTANLASADLYEVPLGDRLVPIGVIQLPSFYGEGEFGEGNISTSRDIAELIEKLKEKGIEGMVLDLRNNGGGRLDEAVKLAGLFISKGPVVQKRSFNGKIEEDWDDDPSIAYAGPLVVLVSRASASASEIVAGALQSHGRALVVGDESTHGKGTVQAPIDLRSTMRRPYGSPLQVGTVKITVQKFYLPNGASTQNKGVTSDITLPSVNAFLMEGESDLPHALEWDTITPINFVPPESGQKGFSFLDKPLFSFLTAQSCERQQTLEEFDFLRRKIEWMRERSEEKSASLNLAARLERKAADKAFQDALEDERNRLSKADSFAVTSVDLEITRQKEASHQAKLRENPLPDGRPRANQFYQKVFYYQAEPDGEIKELWVEYFDYERALDKAAELAALIAEKTGVDVSETEMSEVLTRLKNADRGSDFNPTDPFLAVMGERMPREKIETALSDFYARMVEIDPDVLRKRAQLDIPLREALRIVADWVAFEQELSADAIAAKHAAGDERSAAPAAAAN